MIRSELLDIAIELQEQIKTARAKQLEEPDYIAYMVRLDDKPPITHLTIAEAWAEHDRLVKDCAVEAGEGATHELF